MVERNTQIPVRRRRGGIPWLWLIGLALLGLLLWWVLGNLGRNDNGAGAGTGSNGSAVASAAVAAASSVSPGASGGASGADASGDAGAAPSAGGSATTGGGEGGGSAGPITDLAEIIGAADAAAVAGREVAIEGAPVQSVTGDVTFWVGSSEEDRVFVRMDEEASGGEQGIQVREGQTLRLTGQADEIPADLVEWELSEDDQAALAEEATYVSASKVEIVEE